MSLAGSTTSRHLMGRGTASWQLWHVTLTPLAYLCLSTYKMHSIVSNHTAESQTAGANTYGHPNRTAISALETHIHWRQNQLCTVPARKIEQFMNPSFKLPQKDIAKYKEWNSGSTEINESFAIDFIRARFHPNSPDSHSSAITTQQIFLLHKLLNSFTVTH